MAKSLQQIVEENKMLLITSEISDNELSQTITNLMRWSNEDPKQEIKIFLSSECYEFLNIITIYDVLKKIPNPISVNAIGVVGGLSMLFIAAANKGKRYMLKSSIIAFNQPLGNINSGANQQTEVEIEARNTTLMRKEIEEIYAEAFNKPLEEIHELVEVGKSFTASEAKEYGLIDVIVGEK